MCPCVVHCSVLGSSLQGAFQNVTVNVGAATGSVTVTSSTPMRVSADLGGITTLTIDAPAGVFGLVTVGVGLNRNVFTIWPYGRCTTEWVTHGRLNTSFHAFCIHSAGKACRMPDVLPQGPCTTYASHTSNAVVQAAASGQHKPTVAVPPQCANGLCIDPWQHQP